MVNGRQSCKDLGVGYKCLAHKIEQPLKEEEEEEDIIPQRLQNNDKRNNGEKVRFSFLSMSSKYGTLTHNYAITSIIISITLKGIPLDLPCVNYMRYSSVKLGHDLLCRSSLSVLCCRYRRGCRADCRSCSETILGLGASI